MVSLSHTDHIDSTTRTDVTTFIRDNVIKTIDGMLTNLPPTHLGNCIYRVPDSLHRVNPECYTPRLVAIGPLHRNNPRLKPMEEHKLRLFNEFIAEIDRKNCKIKLAHTIVEFIVRQEHIIRCFYQEEIELDSEDFCRLFLLDSVFIVGLLLKKEDRDPMFGNRWLFNDLVHDILLLENQIPLFVTYYVYWNLKPSENIIIPFTLLVHSFFKDVMNEYDPIPLVYDFGTSTEPRHLIMYLWESLYGKRWLDTSQPQQAKPIKKKNWKSNTLTASRLLEYGVKFEATTTSLLDIQFKSKEGILKIPRLKVNELTETLFHNLLAFEQCNDHTPKGVSDYIIFMDSITDTPKDVKILVGAGIIQDDLQDLEKVSKLFNNLSKVAITDYREFCFAVQSHELNNYRRNWWHQWKARWYNWMVILRRDYFNSPWSTISFIAAVILLVLTLVQTVCSIYQAKGIKM